MNKKPLVSIVIPVYNGSKYMKEAIDSALSQTYGHIEIIVVNDGSKDNGETDRIARSYGDKIRYFTKKNGGVSTALNLAIKEMKGDYFSWLSHDDKFLEDKIEVLVSFLVKNNYINEKVILYSDYHLIDIESNIIGYGVKDNFELSQKPEYSLLRGSVNGITMLIPKKAFDTYGEFDETLIAVQDYVMWRNMFDEYKPIHVPVILAQSRYHSNQVSNTSPHVITEGNKFWIDLVERVHDSRKIELEGSVYNYYFEMAKFLKTTPYLETYEFCNNKVKELEELFVLEKEILVSVVIPTYNRVDETIRAIESVLRQTYKNFEIVIVDDGSDEDISKLISYISSLNNAKLIQLAFNRGASYARNVGIDNSIGEYIAFLDSDDEFLEKKIEVQLERMVLTEAIMTHTSYYRESGYDRVVIDSGKDNGMIFRKLAHSCQIATPTVMLKKRFLDNNNLRFDVEKRIGEDICFWLEILKNKYLVGIDTPLSIVHLDGTNSAYDYAKQFIGYKTILKYLLEDKFYSQFDNEISLVALGLYKHLELANGRELTEKEYQSFLLKCKQKFRKVFKNYPLIIKAGRGIYHFVKGVYRKFKSVIMKTQ